MTFSNGSTIAYTYDANGRKLRTVHNVGGTTTTTDYAGNVIYENGVQKKLLTEEGYVDLTSGTYYYYLKDHQGNNRVVVNSGGTVQETNHYYPFGGTFASGTVQPYKYNGKELDTKAGLNWYDYGARHYDAALGRFTTQDPLAEKDYLNSPYNYCGNSPVNYIDPTGKMKVIYNPDGTYKETKYNNWFHNTFIGRREYIDYGDRMVELSEKEFWQWQETGKYDNIRSADDLTSVEFWLNSSSENIVEESIKFISSNLYSLVNSPVKAFTGRTLGGFQQTPLERMEGFVDFVSNLTPAKLAKKIHPGSWKMFKEVNRYDIHTVYNYRNRIKQYNDILYDGNKFNTIIDYYITPLNELNEINE